MNREFYYKDYYKTLGVNREAGSEEIKKAFRQLALQCHPDRNPGDKNAEERFKSVSEAYGVLIDPEKRRTYELIQQRGADAAVGSGFRYTQEDIFGDMFRNRDFGTPRKIFSEICSEIRERTISSRI